MGVAIFLTLVRAINRPGIQLWHRIQIQASATRPSVEFGRTPKTAFIKHDPAWMANGTFCCW